MDIFFSPISRLVFIRSYKKITVLLLCYVAMVMDTIFQGLVQ